MARRDGRLNPSPLEEEHRERREHEAGREGVRVEQRRVRKQDRPSRQSERRDRAEPRLEALADLQHEQCEDQGRQDGADETECPQRVRRVTRLDDPQRVEKRRRPAVSRWRALAPCPSRGDRRAA